jgi:hypothetical protein
MVINPIQVLFLNRCRGVFLPCWKFARSIVACSRQMTKQSYILNLLFTLLAFVSLIGAAWAVWVYLHTPLLIHDTMHVVGQQLTEPQRNALYPALGKAYRPIVFGGAIVVVAWVILAGVLILRKPSNPDTTQ